MDMQTVLALLLVALAAVALVRHQVRAFRPVPAAAKPSACGSCPSGGSCKKPGC